MDGYFANVYFSLGAILSDTKRAPSTFKVPAFNLGFIDPAGDDADLAEGTRVDLPAWLAATLACRNMVEVSPPPCFSQRQRITLLAEPRRQNMRDRSLYFYENGMKMSPMLQQHTGNSHQLAAVVLRVLAARLISILDHSQNSRDEDVSSSVKPLTELERAFFSAGYRSAADYFGWKCREGEKLSGFVPSAKRRRLV